MIILPIILITYIFYLDYKQKKIYKLQPCKVVDNSLKILNERFVHGEISKDEYVRLKNILTKK